MMKNKTSIAVLLCLVPPLIWGGMFPVAATLEPTVNMFAMTLIRYGLVAIILAVMLWRLEGRGAFATEHGGLRLFLLGSAGFAGFGLLAFTALSYTSASNVSLVMAMMPAIGAMLAAISERALPQAYTLVAVLLAFAGVSLVLTDGDYGHLISTRDGVGELLALLGAICWVVYTRGAARTPHWSTLRYTTVTTILGVPTIAVATAVATAIGFVRMPSLGAVLGGWPQLAYLVALAGVIAVLFWNEGNKRLGPLNGTLFMNVVPLTTFIIMSVVSSELPSPAAVAGVALVVGGLLMNNVFMRRRARQDALRSTDRTPVMAKR